ncbi:hypothetical protein PR048_024380 [Dryococelus australis]|uniref:Uncharacterized protein n=1 Tax=Dryococelus australis TaxID=614101 RepID=A0ABQ9GNI6_9NEOP|nr:hypothetical protein PR048_024380 [Dryococelus australis]
MAVIGRSVRRGCCASPVRAWAIRGARRLRSPRLGGHSAREVSCLSLSLSPSPGLVTARRKLPPRTSGPPPTSGSPCRPLSPVKVTVGSHRRCPPTCDFVGAMSAVSVTLPKCRQFTAISTLASHHGELGSISGWVTGFSQVGIVPDDAFGRRVFSGISAFPPPLHSSTTPYSLQSPSSPLSTSLLRPAQIFSSSFCQTFTCLPCGMCYDTADDAREAEAARDGRSACGACATRAALGGSASGRGRQRRTVAATLSLLPTSAHSRVHGDSANAHGGEVDLEHVSIMLDLQCHEEVFATSSPSYVTADNQCAVDVGMFEHKTGESTLKVSLRSAVVIGSCCVHRECRVVRYPLTLQHFTPCLGFAYTLQPIMKENFLHSSLRPRKQSDFRAVNHPGGLKQGERPTPEDRVVTKEAVCTYSLVTTRCAGLEEAEEPLKAGVMDQGDSREGSRPLLRQLLLPPDHSDPATTDSFKVTASLSTSPSLPPNKTHLPTSPHSTTEAVVTEEFSSKMSMAILNSNILRPQRQLPLVIGYLKTSSTLGHGRFVVRRQARSVCLIISVWSGRARKCAHINVDDGEGRQSVVSRPVAREEHDRERDFLQGGGNLAPSSLVYLETQLVAHRLLSKFCPRIGGTGFGAVQSLRRIRPGRGSQTATRSGRKGSESRVVVRDAVRPPDAEAARATKQLGWWHTSHRMLHLSRVHILIGCSRGTADLLWRSRLVRHRFRMREALGSNPGVKAGGTKNPEVCGVWKSLMNIYSVKAGGIKNPEVCGVWKSLMNIYSVKVRGTKNPEVCGVWKSLMNIYSVKAGGTKNPEVCGVWKSLMNIYSVKAGGTKNPEVCGVWKFVLPVLHRVELVD